MLNGTELELTNNWGQGRLALSPRVGTNVLEVDATFSYANAEGGLFGRNEEAKKSSTPSAYRREHHESSVVSTSLT